MCATASREVLSETFWAAEGAGLGGERAVLVAAGVAALTLAAQAKAPVWPSPAAVSLGAFAVLTLGVAYGPRLGLVTLLAWLGLGAAGFNVFQNTASGVTGLADRMGATGGYLLGYLLAVLALGWAARRGLDRSVGGMALALLAGDVPLYVPGLAWLRHLVAIGRFDPAKYASAWEQTLAWGLNPLPHRRPAEARPRRAGRAGPCGSWWAPPAPDPRLAGARAAARPELSRAA